MYQQIPINITQYTFLPWLTSRKAWTAKQVSQSCDPLVPCTRQMLETWLNNVCLDFLFFNLFFIISNAHVFKQQYFEIFEFHR